MNAKSGDRIVMLGKVKRAAANERAGVVDEVLGENPPRYLIRWDNGRSTVLVPLPEEIRFVPTAKKATPKSAAKRAEERAAAKRANAPLR